MLKGILKNEPEPFVIVSPEMLYKINLYVFEPKLEFDEEKMKPLFINE